jgi:hypothetical protein
MQTPDAGHLIALPMMYIKPTTKKGVKLHMKYQFSRWTKQGKKNRAFSSG